MLGLDLGFQGILEGYQGLNVYYRLKRRVGSGSVVWELSRSLSCKECSIDFLQNYSFFKAVSDEEG
jgi:hypothetical protein